MYTISKKERKKGFSTFVSTRASKLFLYLIILILIYLFLEPIKFIHKVRKTQHQNPELGHTQGEIKKKPAKK